MNTVVTTILFDGRFWVAVIEKIDPRGTVHVGRHVFGAEPDNNDLLSFYLYRYSEIAVYESPVRVRLKAKRTIAEEARSTVKAKTAFKDAQSITLSERNAVRREGAKKSEREKYLVKAKKRKKNTAVIEQLDRKPSIFFPYKFAKVCQCLLSLYN